jgi:predicted unusual protein kinase regulating ubiquinone biosynthesis (AarF/ABC1/UbiB family)
MPENRRAFPGGAAGYGDRPGQPPGRETPRPGTLRRAWQVLRAATKHLIVPWLLRRETPSRAERMQAALEELGGTWVKLGQALALRFDILPADYCLQFFQLLNQVRPFPADDVRRTIESELGRPLETLFPSFDWEPLAAASIGQVHRAALPDGAAVAVKVQRPGIRDLIRSDLRLMRWMAALLDGSGLLGYTRARDLVTEFARWTEEELDYRIEARHATMLRRNADGDPLERNPRVYVEYTTARVLTLEFLDGVPVIEIVAAFRRGDAAWLEALSARGHDTRRIARHIVWNALNQIYRFGYFHADPHPANVIVLPGDAIGYVDFGIVGRLDDRTTDSLRYFAQSLFAGHTANAVDEFLRFLVPSARTDLDAARRDLVEAMNNYVESARVGPEGISLSEDIFEIEMLAVVRAHSMALAPEAARYLKAVLTAEAMVKELDPRFDLRAHENRFFGRLMRLEAVESLDPRRVGQAVLDARFRLRRLMESLDPARGTPGRLLTVAHNVRRRVQVFSALTMAGWAAVLAAIWTARARSGLPLFGYPVKVVALAGAVIGLVLLLFSILQVRRLPSESEAGRLYSYPRRMR